MRLVMIRILPLCGMAFDGGVRLGLLLATSLAIFRLAGAVDAVVQFPARQGCALATKVHSAVPQAPLTLRGGADGEAGEEKKPFNLDAWKRLYTNTDDTNQILGEFWASLDTEEYSIWFSEYKHNEDYTKKLMASNLIGGFFQRLDNAGGRKVSFANVHVFGQEPELELAGCWLVKGQDVPKEFKEVADFDAWEWSKADLSDPAVRQTVEDYWRWEGDFGKGRVWAAGKTYK